MDHLSAVLQHAYTDRTYTPQITRACSIKIGVVEVNDTNECDDEHFTAFVSVSYS